jgi:hypothetical protein
MEQDQVQVPGTGGWHKVPEGNVRHIGDLVCGWAEQTLIACSAGERYWFNTSMVAVPATGGRVMTMTAVVIYTPSPLLGQPPVGTVRMIGDMPSKADVETAVRSAVEELRASRSNELATYKPMIGRPVKDQPQA